MPSVDNSKILSKTSLVDTFSYLYEKDLCSCSSVSKGWKVAASDDDLWRALFLRAFPNRESHFPFDSQNKVRLSQKEIFMLRDNLELGRFVGESFPEKGCFFPIHKGGNTFFLSETGNVYTWNSCTEKFDLKMNLLNLNQSNVSYCAKQIFSVTDDAFAVLFRRSGIEIERGRHNASKVVKVAGDILKFFDTNIVALGKIIDVKYVLLNEIDFHEKVKELRVCGEKKNLRASECRQFFGIMESGPLINVTEEMIQRSILRGGGSVSIANINRGKCLISDLSYRNCKDVFTVRLLDISKGTVILNEVGSDISPVFPLHSEFADGHFVLFPEDGKCAIIDLDPKSQNAKTELPFGREFVRLASFTPQGKLLLTDLKSAIILLDPENGWQQIERIKVDFFRNIGCDFRAGEYVISHCFRFEEFRVFNGLNDKVNLQFSGSKNILISFSSEKYAFLIDLENGSYKAVKKSHPEWGHAIGNGMILNGQELFNFNPSIDKVLLKWADDFTECNGYERFGRLPESIRNAIYGELYQVLSERGRLSSISPYWGIGQVAFYEWRSSGVARDGDKPEAIRRVARQLAQNK